MNAEKILLQHFKERLKQRDKNVILHIGTSESGMSGSAIRMGELMNKHIKIKGNRVTINAKKIIEGNK